MNEPKISRRTLLQGVGTAMALPLFDAMIPTNALAQSGKKAVPTRLGFIFVPNGVHMQDWTPTAEGTNYALPYTLEPMQNVKSNILVLSGLAQDKARPNGDGAGDHARSAAAWLTGCQPRKTSGANIKAGISADQYAAKIVGTKTRFASLELGCERGGIAGDCDSGYSCAYSSNIAWRSEATPVAKEINPRLVFERLFGNGDTEETAESRAHREKYRNSILDFVMEDAKSLQAKLGTQDRNKLEEYLSSIREIEQRISNTEKIQQSNLVKSAKVPQGVPSDYGDHARLLFDMWALAFQTDQTRIVTYMLANEGTNRTYKEIGIADGHHELSHHGNDKTKHAKLRQINRYQASHVAYFLEKLQGMKEGGGTVLDHSMIVYGAGIGDGDRHNHDDLAILLAGNGNRTIKTGRHIKYAQDTPLNNLFVSVLDRVGVNVEKLGDSTGRLQQLF